MIALATKFKTKMAFNPAKCGIERRIPVHAGGSAGAPADNAVARGFRLATIGEGAGIATTARADRRVFTRASHRRTAAARPAGTAAPAAGPAVPTGTAPAARPAVPTAAAGSATAATALAALHDAVSSARAEHALPNVLRSRPRSAQTGSYSRVHIWGPPGPPAPGGGRRGPSSTTVQAASATATRAVAPAILMVVRNVMSASPLKVESSTTTQCGGFDVCSPPSIHSTPDLGFATSGRVAVQFPGAAWVASLSRCMRICAASAGVLAIEIARSKACRASRSRPMRSNSAPRTPWKWK